MPNLSLRFAPIPWGSTAGDRKGRPYGCIIGGAQGTAGGGPVFGLDRLAQGSIIEAERALRQAVGPVSELYF